MAGYMTEQEQIELLKKWFREYGFTLLVGILLAVITTIGWHYWQQRQHALQIHASRLFDAMLTARSQNNAEQVRLHADRLIAHYQRTPYAPLAALTLAREEIVRQDYAHAIKYYNWSINHTSDTYLKNIELIRLARLYIEQKNNSKALEKIKQVKEHAFLALTEETKGDIYFAQEQYEQARASYIIALDALPQEDVMRRPLLQIKLDNIPSPRHSN
jgi:predicted negative regulator of RcsB-dependent stress response